MSKREQLLSSIANTIQDYRAGEIPKPTPKHVESWVNQFDASVQVSILREMAYVLKKTYLSLEQMVTFLRDLINTKELVGDDPCEFWKNVDFMNIQQHGHSQTEMLALFNELLKEQCGFGIIPNSGSASTFLYLDDGIFSGNRVLHDLEAWIDNQAPMKAELHIVAIAFHLNGYYYAKKRIEEAATNAGKDISISWWRSVELENRMIVRNNRTDVLRPTHIPDDAAVQEYVEKMIFPPRLRHPGHIGMNALYRSDKGKVLLEQEFLKAGARIRQLQPKLNVMHRLLGHTPLVSLGFGSLIVTFRNCPNNVPPALWVGGSWYPLFPRTLNSKTDIQRLFRRLKMEGKI